MLSDQVIKELQNKIGVKHNVDIQQQGYGGQAMLVIKGQNCSVAQKELITIV